MFIKNHFYFIICIIILLLDKNPYMRRKQVNVLIDGSAKKMMAVYVDENKEDVQKVNE